MYHCISKAAVNPTVSCSVRYFSTTFLCRRNIRNLEWDDIGSSTFKEMRKKLQGRDPILAYQDYGDRKPGIKKEDGTFEVIPEMIPDIVVPDLTGFKLKPYVSYRAPDVKREQFTSEHLFNSVYKNKIVEDFKNNDLLVDGTPKNPSTEETITSEQALLYARQTGSDIFAEDPEDPDPVDVKYWRK